LKRTLVLVTAGILASVLLVGGAGIASAAPPGIGFYIDGDLYRTVGTPTDFSNTGAPDHSFDTIFDISISDSDFDPINVAEAAPGDPGFNGGRWMVHAIVFTEANYQAALADPTVDLNGNGVLDSDEEVQAAIDGGYVADGGVVKTFECPVIPMAKGKNS
jgi:hypothetical protein